MPDPREVEALLEAGPRHADAVPEHLNPECERCKERAARYEHVAAGNGTISEIRVAVDALEAANRAGAPFGRKVKIAGAWACPRCSSAPPELTGGDDNVPLLAVAPNRRARRNLKIRRRG